MRLLGFLIVLLAGCSSPPVEAPKVNNGTIPQNECGPESCEGCCDEEGRCRLGTTDSLCGAAGAAGQECGSGYCTDGTCAPAGCGDGQLNEGEECDGTLQFETTCADLGFLGGELSCQTDCTFNTSSCEVLDCEAAQADPSIGCGFCAPDGSAIVRCGFCRGEQTDEIEACGGGERCYSWTTPRDEHCV